MSEFMTKSCDKKDKELQISAGFTIKWWGGQRGWRTVKGPRARLETISLTIQPETDSGCLFDSVSHAAHTLCLGSTIDYSLVSPTPEGNWLLLEADLFHFGYFPLFDLVIVVGLKPPYQWPLSPLLFLLDLSSCLVFSLLTWSKVK